MKPFHYVIIALVAIGVVTASVLTGIQSGKSGGTSAPGPPPVPIKLMGEIQTISATNSNGPTHGILIPVYATNGLAFARLMPAIMLQCRRQKEKSPPDTSFLLITVFGDASAAELKKVWDAQTLRDRDLRMIIAKMDKAEIARGTADGKTLDSASLK